MTIITETTTTAAPATVYDRFEKHSLAYRGFTIKVKRDIGSTGQSFHLIDGMPCAWGYVVCCASGFLNVMPGATWFQTVKAAKEAVDILIECGGLPVEPWDENVDGAEFWRKMRGRAGQ